MWVRGAAIRPVPRYAVVEAAALDAIERDLADDSPGARDDLDGAFARFESTQPELADVVSRTLAGPLPDTALALGYFLTIAVWLSFERSFGTARLREVTGDAVVATEEAINLEQELRAAHAYGRLDLDAVLAGEQPNLFAFVRGHIEAALERSRRGGAADDAAEVSVVYRAVALLTLCLSHAVLPLDGAVRNSRELMA